MNIKTFNENYTTGKGVFFRHIISEVKEFFEEMPNTTAMKEEFHDTVAFTQMWLYHKYNINGKLWKLGMPSFEKFMARRKVWKQLYKEVGLDENISNCCKNYNRSEKVVKHLGNFGITEHQALEAFNTVIKNTLF